MNRCQRRTPVCWHIAQFTSEGVPVNSRVAPTCVPKHVRDSVEREGGESRETGVRRQKTGDKRAVASGQWLVARGEGGKPVDGRW